MFKTDSSELRPFNLQDHSPLMSKVTVHLYSPAKCCCSRDEEVGLVPELLALAYLVQVVCSRGAAGHRQRQVVV